MSVFTPVGSAGSSSSVVITGSENPVVVNVGMPTANTEYSYSFPVGTKKFYISLRDTKADMKLAYISGDSGITYFTVHRGNWFSEDALTLSAVTLYFQASQASQVAEILYWT